MSEAEKKALKEQLGEMAKKLSDLANMEQRKKQLEEARKNGGLSQQQYEREMEKLQEQSKGLKQLQQLANKMSQAQEAMQKGDMKKAAEAMGMSQQQLQEMAKQLEEMQALDSAMADLQDAKNGMAADGMNQLGDDLNSLGMGMGRRNRGNGNGMGRGRGQGDRPEAPDDTATYKTKAKRRSEGEGRPPGLHHAGQDRQRPDHHRYPGRARGRRLASPKPSPTRRSPRTSKSISGRITTN